MSRHVCCVMIAALVLGISNASPALLPVPTVQTKTSGDVNLAAPTAREKLLLDFGWRFHLGDSSSREDDFGFGSDEVFGKAGTGVGAARTNFNDADWREVNLPHDWAVELEFAEVKDKILRDHGYKPIGRQFPKTSIGWYRRSFTVPASDDGKRIAVKFDGVFRDSMVWFNGHFLGRHASGYSEFTYDVSDYVQYGKKNLLVVRVDASQAEGWFYEGAGIYRHAWLLKYAPLHIPQNGAFVAAEVGDKEALVNIDTEVFNQDDGKPECRLYSVVVDGDGRVVGNASTAPMALREQEKKTVRQQIKLSNPKLWSLETPYLYKLISVVKSRDNVIDRTETSFGVRTIHFDKEKGFFLNGKPVKIKGVCCHQDHAGVGSALPDGLQYYRIERLKEMGCNAYRTSHNPPTIELLEACDRLGMLVMDENRLMGSSPELTNELEQLILRDRNHPSVIVWSIGNEEWAMQNTETGKRIAQSLKRVQRSLDPTRLCTYAGDNGDRYEGINSVVDVRGVNYMGRGDIDKYHREHPDQPMIGTEEASTYCTRGIYANDAAGGFVSDYDVNAPGYGSVAEKWWKFYAARPWFAGGFVWTGFDYRGEPSPYSWPCINSHFGIMDVCGFPKNNYYYYQAWWSDRDVLHVFPHWNWAGKEGQIISVWCQSNCESVELFVNGKSFGRKSVEPNSHVEWNVPYEAGVLEARGIRNGKELTSRIETTGAPVSLRLTPDRSSINADGEDVCVVNVTALDAQGREVPVADSLIHFSISGEGQIIGVGNGNPSSHERDKYITGGYQRRLFNGKCQIILQSTRKAGAIELKADSEGLRTEILNVRTNSSAGRAFVGPVS